MNVRLICLTTGVLICLAVLPAHAAVMDGQVLQSTMRSSFAPPHGPVYNLIFAQSNFVVGPAVELINFGEFLDIDVSDSNILIVASIDRAATSDPQMLNFVDANGTIPRFVSATINPLTTVWDGFEQSRVFVQPNSIGVYIGGLAATSGQQVSLDVLTMIPEPAAGTLAVLAIAALPIAARVFRRGA
jgi:hypothetical protein